MPSRILAIWDLGLSPPSLGGLLLLVQEALMLRAVQGASDVDLCFVGVGIGAAQGALSPLGPEHELSGWIGTVLEIEGVGDAYVCASRSDLAALVERQPRRFQVWPPLEALNEGATYHSTLRIQTLVRQTGARPRLQMKRPVRERARDLLRRDVGSRLCVTLHLKANGTHDSTDAWLGFLRKSSEHRDLVFLLVGDDDPGLPLATLPKVLRTRERGSDLGCDLALIQASSLFMGVASGPCQAAVLSDVPYLIYKHPNHHAEEMRRELGMADHFPFAGALQKVFRLGETTDRLLSDFSSVQAHLTQGTGPGEPGHG